MKKVLAFLLVAIMVVALAACGGDETSKTPANSDPLGESTPVEDSDPAESEPEEDSTPAESTPDESVPDESEPEESLPVDDSGNVIEIPEFTNKFVSYGTASTDDHKGDGTSFSLTGYNEDLAYGAVILYDARYGAATPAGLEDYAVLVAEYQAKPLFGYVKSAYHAVGEASAAVNIPADGFVVVIHKYQEAAIKVAAAYGTDDSIFPHGIQVKDITWNATYLTAAPTLDGKVNANEYGALVDAAEIDNPIWDYSQFAKTENYDIVSDLYIGYDANYLYFAMVVGMDYHNCPDLETGNFWKYCTIQVNVTTEGPNSDYISEYYDWGSGTGMNKQTTTDGKFVQLGYGVSNAGEDTGVVYMGGYTPEEGTYCVVRDDTNQQTIYEVKLPWDKIGFETAPSAGDEIGFSVSINATPEGGEWANLRMRNGGGIIGRNDLSKMATVVLK